MVLTFLRPSTTTFPCLTSDTGASYLAELQAGGLSPKTSQQAGPGGSASQGEAAPSPETAASHGRAERSRRGELVGE